MKRYGQAQYMHRAVEHNGMVFLAGATCDDASLDMAGQTREALAKVDQYLASAGTDKHKLISATIYVTDISKKPEMNAVWEAWLLPEELPTRATIGVADLGGSILLEISIVAYK
jgi:enamine deaminase RidA (YjgF/YER057c/UK114 family)